MASFKWQKVRFHKNNPNGITIFCFDDKSTSMEISFQSDNNNEFQTYRMEKEDKWWKKQIKGNGVEFFFRGNDGKKINLGVTSGTSNNNFKTTHNLIWIKDGVIYTYNPLNSTKPKDEIVILTLNMHTYQEKDQNTKFNIIVKAIHDLDADIIILQECAQNKNAEIIISDHYGKQIKKDNMAMILAEKLTNNYETKYDYFWDWSHYGWVEWEEGSAILSKHQFIETNNQYVTTNKSKTFWQSRNIITSRLNIPQKGEIDVYSVHLGWWNDEGEPFKKQFDKLINWQNERYQENLLGVFTVGDFNVESGTEGYEYILKHSNFIDTYYYANPHGLYDPTIAEKITGWEKGGPNGKRIDYIYLNKNSNFEVILAQRIFTKDSYGTVSDHNGTYVRLKLKK